MRDKNCLTCRPLILTHAILLQPDTGSQGPGRGPQAGQPLEVSRQVAQQKLAMELRSDWLARCSLARPARRYNSLLLSGAVMGARECSGLHVGGKLLCVRCSW